MFQALEYFACSVGHAYESIAVCHELAIYRALDSQILKQIYLTLANTLFKKGVSDHDAHTPSPQEPQRQSDSVTVTEGF